MLQKTLFTILFTISLAFFSCSNTNAKQNKNVIYTSLRPYAWILKELTKSKWTIYNIVPQNQNPHTFHPSPQQISKLNHANYYFSTDEAFETEVIKKLNNKIQILSLTKSKDTTHHHHSPHKWLTPTNLIQIIKQFEKNLTKIDPENKVFYHHNALLLLEKTKITNSQLIEKFKKFKGKSILVYHDAFKGFISALGLKEIAIQVNGKDPSPKQIQSFISLAKKNKITTIFSQPQFSDKIPSLLAKELNCKLIQINPLEENILDNYETVGEKFLNSFISEK